MKCTIGLDGSEMAATDNSILQQPGGWNGRFIENRCFKTYGGYSAIQITDSTGQFDARCRENIYDLCRWLACNESEFKRVA